MSVFMIIAIVFFVIAVILLAVTITIFFTQNIAAVIGDLSGKTAQKQIQQIRAQGAGAVRTANRKSSSQSKNAAFDNMLANSAPRTAGTATASNERKGKTGRNPKTNDVRPISPVTHKPTNGTVAFGAGYGEMESNGNGINTVGGGIVNSEGATDVLSQDMSETPTGVLDQTETPTDVLDNSEAPTGVLDITETPTGVLDDSEAPTGLLDQTEAPTGVLDDSEAPTGLLSEDTEGATGVLSDEVGTALLSSEMGTTILSNDNDDNSGFQITSDETFGVTDVSID